MLKGWNQIPLPGYLQGKDVGVHSDTDNEGHCEPSFWQPRDLYIPKDVLSLWGFLLCFYKEDQNWILEILLCWIWWIHMHSWASSTRLVCRLRLSQCGRSLFGLLLLVLLFRLLGTNVLGTFFIVLGRNRSEGGSKAECHDEVEEHGDPIANGTGCWSMAEAGNRLAWTIYAKMNSMYSYRIVL